VGFRMFGKSKESRDDPPQDLIGMVATPGRDSGAGVVLAGGTTTDSALIRQAREGMRLWTLTRVMPVADPGFSAEDTALNYRQLLEVDPARRGTRQRLPCGRERNRKHSSVT
jgi:hypothetical protein